MATGDKVDQAVALMGRHRAQLGYIMRRSLEAAQARGGLYTAPGGAAYVWHRRDRQTTIHAICSEEVGAGSTLLGTIIEDCRLRGQTTILAKCPANLSSNAWYARRGFSLLRTDPGKHVALNVWTLDLVGS